MSTSARLKLLVGLCALDRGASAYDRAGGLRYVVCNLRAIELNALAICGEEFQIKYVAISLSMMLSQ